MSIFPIELAREEIKGCLRRQEELGRHVRADVSDLRHVEVEKGTGDEEDGGHQGESLGIFQGLEEEDEDHHDHGGDGPHDPLHGSLAEGGEDVDLQELGQSVDAQLDEEDVETDDDGLDQPQCGGRDVQSKQSWVGDESEAEKQDYGGEEADEIQEPQPHLHHHVGHQAHHYQFHH